jgi:hypothetical protein
MRFSRHAEDLQTNHLMAGLTLNAQSYISLRGYIVRTASYQ